MESFQAAQFVPYKLCGHRAVQVVTCFSMSEIHQLLELPLKLGAVVGVHVGRRPRAWNTFFMPAARKTATFLVSASMATNIKGYGLPRRPLCKAVVASLPVLVHPEAVQKPAGVAHLSLLQRLRYVSTDTTKATTYGPAPNKQKPYYLLASWARRPISNMADARQTIKAVYKNQRPGWSSVAEIFVAPLLAAQSFIKASR